MSDGLLAVQLEQSSPIPLAVDLSCAPGEILALVGPSGSGKSTVLRCIAGLGPPDAGSLRLEGRDLAGVPPHARPVNTMFQSYALFPHMSVAANVAFGLWQEGVPRGERRARVAEALALLRIGHLARRRPHQLSGGERQRTALARALVKRPRLLLLDEPLSALDRPLREAMRFELAALQRRFGLACILVTHDQEEALSLAQRIAVMEAGRILEVGTPDRLYERPRTRFAAAFLGRVNLLSGEAAPGPLGPQLAVPGLETPLPLPQAAPLAGPATLALRPEVLAFRPPRPGEAALAGAVEEAAYHGERSLLLVRVAPEILLKVSAPGRSGAGLPRRGETVTVSWDAEAGHLLEEGV